jgi:hypothetical protein
VLRVLLACLLALILSLCPAVALGGPSAKNADPSPVFTADGAPPTKPAQTPVALSPTQKKPIETVASSAKGTSYTMADLSGHQKKMAEIETARVKRLMSLAWRHYTEHGNKDGEYAELYEGFTQALKRARNHPECRAAIARFRYMTPPRPTEAARRAHEREMHLERDRAGERAKAAARISTAKGIRSRQVQSTIEARSEETERKKEGRAEYLRKRMRRHDPW